MICEQNCGGFFATAWLSGFVCGQYMTQIREKQRERDGGSWPGLAAAQRAEAETGYRHMSMLARFHNIMGNETIHTLEMMTTDIRTIFTNAVMVDRIAAMLNYFLLHLVSDRLFCLLQIF